MTQLHAASHQWAHRPADERFLSLGGLRAYAEHHRSQCKPVITANRKLAFAPSANVCDDIYGLQAIGPNGHRVDLTHWSFGQLAALAGAPAGYLRKLPGALAADNLNHGLQFLRDVEEVGILLHRDPGETPTIRAATGPNYGRIWDADICRLLYEEYGDGNEGAWRVPGIFGRPLTEITKDDTTLYRGDRSMFVFLADEENRIEVEGGDSLARGFFAWNSEVGASTFGVGFFLFRYACSNRIVWGAEHYVETRLRHTAGAPIRWAEQVVPALKRYATMSSEPMTKAILEAQKDRLGDTDAVREWLQSKRFSASTAQAAMVAHQAEEGRPIASRWDAVQGLTAVARSIPWADARVELERQAGQLLPFEMPKARDRVAVH